MSSLKTFTSFGNLLSTPLNHPSELPKSVAKSKPLYCAGIALLVGAFIAGLSVVVLHYDTTCGPGNIFACHSMFDLAGGNILPILNGVILLVFLIGLILAFRFGPPIWTPVVNNPSTQDTDKK